MPEPNALSLFEAADLPTAEESIANNREIDLYEASLNRSHKDLVQLLPDPVLPSLPNQKEAILRQHQLELLMGSAGSAILRCEAECPFRTECAYFLSDAQPIGQLCPLELVLLRERFQNWLRELKCTFETISASERLAIGSLCSLEIELQRVRKILSRARNAEMDQLSVRDINVETGQPICWEHVIHIAAQREDQIMINIRMLMKDFELTPEQKTKRARALGIRDSNNMASKQSSLYDKIQNRTRQPAPITVESS